MERSYFLIIGNGRTGSTWLLTSFDRLSDVTARFELKWADEGTRADAHRVIGNGVYAKPVIEQATIDPEKNARIRGSKLIFDPYRFFGPQTFEAIERAIERDVKLILLKRRYRDTWLSWKARGVYHKVDETVAPIDANSNPMLEAMRTMEMPQNQHLVLHHNGGALDQSDGIPYPLSSAIDDLLQFYANDMQALSFVMARGGQVVDYDGIADDFASLAEYVGSSATPDEIGAINRQPQTLKLEALGGYLHPAGGLDPIAQVLDNAFWQTVKGQLAHSSAFRWFKGLACINAPRADEVFSAFSFDAVGVRLSGREVRWKPQKPLFP
jgi:hypothetical protein